MTDPTTQTDLLLWSAQTTAKALGISDRSLWSLTFGRKNKDGIEQVPLEMRIPHVRLGHRVMYDPEDVRAWIKRSKQVGGDSDSSRVE